MNMRFNFFLAFAVLTPPNDFFSVFFSRYRDALARLASACSTATTESDSSSLPLDTTGVPPVRSTQRLTWSEDELFLLQRFAFANVAAIAPWLQRTSLKTRSVHAIEQKLREVKREGTSAVQRWKDLHASTQARSLGSVSLLPPDEDSLVRLLQDVQRNAGGPDEWVQMTSTDPCTGHPQTKWHRTLNSVYRMSFWSSLMEGGASPACRKRLERSSALTAELGRCPLCSKRHASSARLNLMCPDCQSLWPKVTIVQSGEARIGLCLQAARDVRINTTLAVYSNLAEDQGAVLIQRKHLWPLPRIKVAVSDEAVWIGPQFTLVDGQDIRPNLQDIDVVRSRGIQQFPNPVRCGDYIMRPPFTLPGRLAQHHCKDANSKITRTSNHKYIIKAIRNIKKGDKVLVDYEIAAGPNEPRTPCLCGAFQGQRHYIETVDTPNGPCHF